MTETRLKIETLINEYRFWAPRTNSNKRVGVICLSRYLQTSSGQDTNVLNNPIIY
jgi:hypothetical protein